MKIKIRTLKQEKYEFDITDDTTVADLNKMIEEKYQHKASWQILIFSGKQLARENTIKSYNVGENDFLVLMVKKPKDEDEKPKAAAPAPTPAAQPTTAASSAPVASTNPPSSPSASPAPSPSPAPAPSGAGNPMVDPISGQNVQAMVDQLSDMGFPRDQVQLALRASFFNMDRAVEYLTTGIPPGVVPALVPQNAAPAQAPAPAPAPARQPAPGGGLQLPANLIPPGLQAQAQQQQQQSPLDALRNNPMFPLLQQIAQQDPNRLTDFLAQLAQTNPDLLRTIVQHRDEFIRLLSGGAEGGGAAPAGPRPGTIAVTPEDQEKIANIIGITGIAKERVMEAYFLFEKDEALAINYLLNNPEEPFD